MTVGFPRVMWPRMRHLWLAVFSGSQCQFTCENIDVTVGARRTAKQRSGKCALLLFHREHVPIAVWRGGNETADGPRSGAAVPAAPLISLSASLREWSRSRGLDVARGGVWPWRWRAISLICAEKRRIVDDRGSILHDDHETDVCAGLSFSIRRCQRSVKTLAIMKVAIFGRKPTNKEMNILWAEHTCFLFLVVLNTVLYLIGLRGGDRWRKFRKQNSSTFCNNVRRATKQVLFTAYVLLGNFLSDSPLGKSHRRQRSRGTTWILQVWRKHERGLIPWFNWIISWTRKRASRCFCFKAIGIKHQIRLPGD